VDRRSLPQKLEARSKRSLVRGYAIFEVTKGTANTVAHEIRAMMGKTAEVTTTVAGPFEYAVVLTTDLDQFYLRQLAERIRLEITRMDFKLCLGVPD